MNRCIDFLSRLHGKGVNLWLDDGRLRYQSSKSALSAEDIVTLRAMKGEIVEVLRTCRQENIRESATISRCDGAPVPLTLQQLWLWQAIQRGALSNLVPCILQIRGPLNPEALRKSLEELIRENDALRTRIVVADGFTAQRFEEAGEYQLRITDLSRAERGTIDAVVHDMLEEIAHQDEDLALLPLFETRLLKLSDQEYMLLWSIHHLIIDMISLNLMFEELWFLYGELSAGRTPTKRKKSLEYADYARWQNGIEQSELSLHRSYWKSRVQSATGICWPFSILELGNTLSRHHVPLSFGREVSRQLQKLAANEGTTLAMAVLAVYAVVVSRMCSQNDVVLTLSVAGRDRSETQKMIGYCAYALYVRIQFATHETFSSLIAKVTHEFSEALSHPDFGSTVAEHSDLHGCTLFQWAAWETGLPFDSAGSLLKEVGLQGEGRVAEFSCKREGVFSQYRIILSLGESGEGVSGQISCAAAISELMERFAQDLRKAAEEMVRNPHSYVR